MLLPTFQLVIATSPLMHECIPSWLCCADKAIRRQNKKHMSDFVPETHLSSLMGRIPAGMRISPLHVYLITWIHGLLFWSGFDCNKLRKDLFLFKLHLNGENGDVLSVFTRLLYVPSLVVMQSSAGMLS